MSQGVHLTKVQRSCVKIALMHMAIELNRLGYKWDPRLKDAFVHGYDAVRDPGEDSIGRMFRPATPDELPAQDIAERMRQQGFALPAGANDGLKL